MTELDAILSSIRPGRAEVAAWTEGARDVIGVLSKKMRPSNSLRCRGALLSGSLIRGTTLRPSGLELPDVDVLLLTDVEFEHSPNRVLAWLLTVLSDRYGADNVSLGRSVKVRLFDSVIDVLVGAISAEAATRMAHGERPAAEGHELELNTALDFSALRTLEPIHIPARCGTSWVPATPFSRMHWLIMKTAEHGPRFVELVLLIKWWRRFRAGAHVHPKGYAIEHLVALACPERLTSLPDAFVETLETMWCRYKGGIDSGVVPHLPDISLPEHSVLDRVGPHIWASFVRDLGDSATKARRALGAESVTAQRIWQELFGPRPFKP